jgi:hypothetical protein
MNISLFKSVLIFNTFYIVILLLAWVLANDSVSKVISFFPVFLLTYLLLFNCKKLRYLNKSKTDLLIVGLLFIGSTLHVLLSPYFLLSDFIKFIFIFLIFFIAKYGLNRYKKIDHKLFFVPMLFFPLMCFCVYMYDTLIKHEATNPVLFFSNRNNAIAYTFVCIFVLSTFTKTIKNGVLATLIVTIFYGTLGALLAFIVAFSFTMFKWSLSAASKVLALLFFVFLMFFYLDLEIFKRISIAINGLISFFELYSLSDLKHVKFGEIVAMQDGSDDVSMFFRLKHWGEILAILMDDYSNLIFGWGMGASVELTSMSLVPHNDWLRVFFELGIFNFLSFTLLNAVIFIKLRGHDQFLAALFLTLCIYMFSENLINNFLITSFLYFSCGLFFKNENSKYRT